MDRERRAAADGERDGFGEPTHDGEGRSGSAGGSGTADGSGSAGGRSIRVETGPPPESGKARLSLWLGAAGLALGFLLLFAILTPAAIVAAVGGLREIRLQPALRGRWKAWTAIGLAIVAPVLWVSVFLTFADNGTFGIF